MEQYIQSLQNFMVLVRCYTFNHSKYITDALNGFVMQQTNFPFVVVVVDDASTDGEQTIIQDYIKEHFDCSRFQKETDYANIIFSCHKSNKNCYIAAYYLKENHYSKQKPKVPYIRPWHKKCKYEALCEGDDYWTDPLKLQIQIDFLENHSDYSFICHRFNVYEQNAKRFLNEYAYKYYKEDENLEITLDLFSKVWVTQYLTTIVRIDTLLKISPMLKRYHYSRDIHLFYHLLKEGRGISLNRNMGIYRWHDGGIASPLKGSKRFLLQYKILKEWYEYTNDDIVKGKLLKCINYYLLYTSLPQISYSIFKDGIELASNIQKCKLCISICFPVVLYRFSVNLYRKFYLKKNTLD